MAFFKGLTSSDVLIFIAKVKLNALYKAIYLCRSIRPNKYPKIEFQIESNVRHSLLYFPFPLNAIFKHLLELDSVKHKIVNCTLCHSEYAIDVPDRASTPWREFLRMYSGKDIDINPS